MTTYGEILLITVLLLCFINRHITLISKTWKVDAIANTATIPNVTIIKFTSYILIYNQIFQSRQLCRPFSYVLELWDRPHRVLKI